MKRSIAFALCLVLVFSFVFHVSADENEGRRIDPNITPEELESSIEQLNTYFQIGQDLLGKRISNYLNVPLLRQDDSRWANTTMPCGHSGHTYGEVGCGMTACAMVVRFYGNSSATPVTVATNYGSGCCNFNYTTLFNRYNLTTTSYYGSNYTYAQLKSLIAGAIQMGHPVVVRLNNGRNHFVTAYGYASSGNTHTIYIRDPEGDIAYTNLDQYYNAGWSVGSLCVVE